MVGIGTEGRDENEERIGMGDGDEDEGRDGMGMMGIEDRGGNEDGMGWGRDKCEDRDGG